MQQPHRRLSEKARSEMFKKGVEARSHHRLSGADRKKLKRTVRDRFPRLSDADIDVLLPVEIKVSKYQNRVLVYSIEEGGCPMFLDVDGRSKDIFPTVYALWKVPNFLPSFMLKGGEVSRYIIGGADLMFPGISVPADGLPSFVAGEAWSVKVPGNPAPIAVGTTTMSCAEALEAGLRGKALKIVHYFGDLLWESGEAPYVPNAGFYKDAVVEDPNLSSADSAEVSESNDGANDGLNDQLNGVNGEEMGQHVDNAHVQAETSSASGAPVDAGNEIVGELAATVGDLKLTDDDSVDQSNVEDIQDTHPLTTEDVDMLLEKCLLQALHTTVKDKDLPIPGSILWSNYILPCRPSGITLDIKKSSYKKLSKWLQAKSSSGLVRVKEDKYKKESMLGFVNRTHPDYSSFKPEKRKVEESVSTGAPAVNESRSDKILEVAEIYKPSVHVKSVFASVGADTGELYTASEATDIAFRYVEKENLVKPTDKSFIILDATLCDALFKGAIKKGSMYPSEIHKRDLGAAFVNRMQPHHIVTRGNDSVVRKGGLKTVQIMTERRQGNKKMTKLSGLETFLVDPEALASELQKKFACSTTMAELPGKKGLEVLVQGGVIENLAKHLIEQYGIPKRYIEVLDKTKR